jgi:hypothetical protein
VGGGSDAHIDCGVHYIFPDGEIMTKDEEIDYDALDDISKKYDLVLQALENQKTVVVNNSIMPSKTALMTEIDEIGDPYLSALIAQHLKALDDQYLVDEKIKQYQETFIRELSDELRDVYNKVKQMELNFNGSKRYVAQKKIEYDEDGIGVELSPPRPIPKVVSANISSPKKPEPTDEQLDEAMEQARRKPAASPPQVDPEAEFVKKPEPSRRSVSGEDKSKLVQSAHINLPIGTRTISNIIEYVQNNYGVELKKSAVSYYCIQANLKLEGSGGAATHKKSKVSEKSDTVGNPV